MQRTQPFVKSLISLELQNRESFLQRLRPSVHISDLILLCQLQTLCAARSLETLCLSMTFSPRLEELPGFWGSMVFHYAFIPRKGSGNKINSSRLVLIDTTIKYCFHLINQSYKSRIDHNVYLLYKPFHGKITPLRPRLPGKRKATAN